jgi:hypothetical protein
MSSDDNAWERDTGLTCSFDGEVIEYTDGVVIVLVVRPFLVDGRLTFYDMKTADEDDYLYQPVIFHARNWDDIQEQYKEFLDEKTPVPCAYPVVNCTFCKSGVQAGEVMGVATFGEVHRSQRNPDLRAYGNHFVNLDRSPSMFCIACLRDLNHEVQTLWEDGVSQNDECSDGTYMRCWRHGCDGNCEKKEE